MNGKTYNLRMHAHMFVGVCVRVCVCVRLYACSYYIYKMFPHTEMYSLFHSISFKKKQDLSKQNKMSNITTEMKTLELSTIPLCSTVRSPAL